MEKILIAAGIGIFLGAFAMEIIHWKSPETFNKLEMSAAKLANSLSTAFKEGYKDSAEPEPEPSVA